MNKPVSFEIAKLLKAKGFDTPIRSAWYLEDVAYWNCPKNHNESNVKVSAPTIADVVMWLYEKHGIWISSEPFIKNNNSGVNIYKIFKEGLIDTISRGSLGYDSPTESYEAAIDYTLNNLI